MVKESENRAYLDLVNTAQMNKNISIEDNLISKLDYLEKILVVFKNNNQVPSGFIVKGLFTKKLYLQKNQLSLLNNLIDSFSKKLGKIISLEKEHFSDSLNNFFLTIEIKTSEFKTSIHNEKEITILIKKLKNIIKLINSQDYKSHVLGK